MCCSSTNLGPSQLQQVSQAPQGANGYVLDIWHVGISVTIGLQPSGFILLSLRTRTRLWREDSKIHPRSVAATAAPFHYTTYPRIGDEPQTSRQVVVWAVNWTADEMRRATKEKPPPQPAYGESVKRHLDIDDPETSLNDVGISQRPLQ